MNTGSLSLLTHRRTNNLQNSLHQFIQTNRKLINDKLNQYVNSLDIPTRLKQSMLYSIQAGGKRLRPILLMASFSGYDSKISKTYTTAIALEMIHTYSLIHDDLPAMDDDDYRRGKMTNHKAFDEATAILAGDALLTYSFEVIAYDELLTEQEKVYLIKHLSKASGPKGMVSGQMLDMESENKQIDVNHLENIHTLKTGALIKFAILAGAYLGQANQEQMKYLSDFAYYLGLIFQIQDDILDVIGDPVKLGKPVGSDKSNEKNTYPKLLGLNDAKKQRNYYIQKAKNALTKADARSSYLALLTDHLALRDH